MTRLAAYIHILSNVMLSKRFRSHLILTLSIKNKIRSRWEKFAPSYNPFFRIAQITILATTRIARTPHSSHLDTEALCSTETKELPVDFQLRRALKSLLELNLVTTFVRSAGSCTKGVWKLLEKASRADIRLAELEHPSPSNVISFMQSSSTWSG